MSFEPATEIKTKAMGEWSDAAVLYWLEKSDMPSKFIAWIKEKPENSINGAVLKMLDGNALAQCGVDNPVHRLKLIVAIANYGKESAPTAAAAVTADGCKGGGGGGGASGGAGGSPALRATAAAGGSNPGGAAAAAAGVTVTATPTASGGLDNTAAPHVSVSAIVPPTAFTDKDLCKQCKLWPRRVEGKTTHDFCSKTCRNQFNANPNVNVAVQNHKVPSAGDSGRKCRNCGVRDVFIEANGRVHDFCGFTCAKAWANGANQKQQTAASPGSVKQQSSSTSVGTVASNADVCKYCKTNPPYVDPSGQKMMFCCRRHAHLWAVANTGPKSQVSSYGDARLVQLQPNEAHYQNISEQFFKSWVVTQQKPLPKIDAILEVWNSSLWKRFTSYKQQIETKNGTANVRRRWHGTSCQCGFNPKSGSYVLCAGLTCSVCNICKTGFLLRFSKTNTGFGRFGDGLYFAPNSSKSHDYTDKQGNMGNRKVLLLAQVVCGKTKKFTDNQQHLKAAPAGHDAVVGETGGALNYSELIVYDEAAAIVTAIVVYTP